MMCIYKIVPATTHSAKFALAAVLAFPCMLAAPVCAASYPNYYKAKEALANGDCASAVDYLYAFKAEKRDLFESHRGFAARVDSQIDACLKGNSGGVSGIFDDIDRFGDEQASEADLLPDDPPD